MNRRVNEAIKHFGKYLDHGNKHKISKSLGSKGVATLKGNVLKINNGEDHPVTSRQQLREALQPHHREQQRTLSHRRKQDPSKSWSRATRALVTADESVRDPANPLYPIAESLRSNAAIDKRGKRALARAMAGINRIQEILANPDTAVLPPNLYALGQLKDDVLCHADIAMLAKNPQLLARLVIQALCPDATEPKASIDAITEQVALITDDPATAVFDDSISTFIKFANREVSILNALEQIRAEQTVDHIVAALESNSLTSIIDADRLIKVGEPKVNAIIIIMAERPEICAKQLVIGLLERPELITSELISSVEAQARAMDQSETSVTDFINFVNAAITEARKGPAPQTP